jgi:hypothetical protein
MYNLMTPDEVACLFGINYWLSKSLIYPISIHNLSMTIGMNKNRLKNAIDSLLSLGVLTLKGSDRRGTCYSIENDKLISLITSLLAKSNPGERFYEVNEIRKQHGTRPIYSDSIIMNYLDSKFEWRDNLEN